MLKLLLFSTLVAGAFGACLDNGDKLINGLCFKLVNQPMTFEAARDWCHYQNSVTPSYLAYISSASTANFLSTYARTAFSTSTGSFWIGLSRNSSISSTWYWDNGKSLQFSNFQSNQGDFVSQSISNGKWDARKDTGPLPFVCSYDPAAPPTFPTQIPMSTPTMTPPSPTTTECSPQDLSTFLFAYSNDFDPKVVKDSLYRLLKESKYVSTYFSMFGSLRFDTSVPQKIQFFDDFKILNETVYTNLPNPSLGFSNSQQGSDILDVLQNFLSNPSDTPLCGSMVFILMKRYPANQNTSELVENLQNNHVFIQSVISSSPLSSPNYELMYELGEMTNGMTAMAADNEMAYMTQELSSALSQPYQAYSVNKRSNGDNTQSNLPFFQCPGDNNTYTEIMVEISVQDHAPLDTFRSLHMKFININYPPDNFNIDFNQTFAGSTMQFWRNSYASNATYEVILKTEYSDYLPEKLQIRIFANKAVNYWLPYSNWN